MVHASLEAAEAHFQESSRPCDEMYIWPHDPDLPLDDRHYDVGEAPVLLHYDQSPSRIVRSGDLD